MPKLWSRENTAYQELWNIEDEHYIISQITLVPHNSKYNCETMCFKADETGEITEWLELAVDRGEEFPNISDFVEKYKNEITRGGYNAFDAAN